MRKITTLITLLLLTTTLGIAQTIEQTIALFKHAKHASFVQLTGEQSSPQAHSLCGNIDFHTLTYLDLNQCNKRTLKKFKAYVQQADYGFDYEPILNHTEKGEVCYILAKYRGEHIIELLVVDSDVRYNRIIWIVGEQIMPDDVVVF